MFKSLALCLVIAVVANAQWWGGYAGLAGPVNNALNLHSINSAIYQRNIQNVGAYGLGYGYGLGGLAGWGGLGGYGLGPLAGHWGHGYGYGLPFYGGYRYGLGPYGRFW